VALGIGLSSKAPALDPRRSIYQYEHTRWTVSQGAPAGITGITQSPDGYIWLSAYGGVFRFDGLTFERMDGALDQTREGSPWKLFRRPGGEIWIYYTASRRFYAYRSGRLVPLPLPKIGWPVQWIAQTPNGDLWLGGPRSGAPLLHFHRGRWTREDPARPYGGDANLGLLVTADGALWASFSNNVFRLKPNAAHFERIVADPGAEMRIFLDREGRVWVLAHGAIRPLSGPGGRLPVIPPTAVYKADVSSRRGQALFDRDGNLWIARRKDGIEWLRKPSATSSEGTPPPIEFRTADGLTSDAIYSIFEDREGNIWVGTTLGLDRFRDADIVDERGLRDTAAYGDLLFANSAGHVFVAERSRLFEIGPGGPPRAVLADFNEPEAVCEGPGHQVWVATGDRFIILAKGERKTIKAPPGLKVGVGDCGADNWGRMWASAGPRGLYFRTGGGWKRVDFNARDFSPGQMVHDLQGNLWVNGGSAVAVIGPDGPVVLPESADRRLLPIRSIAAGPSGLVLAGDAAVGLLRQGRLALVGARQLGSILGLNGIVQTVAGETWLFTRNGLVRLRTSDLERASHDPGFIIHTRTFGFLDGLIDSNSVRTPRSLVLGGDGRIWASTSTGIVWIDPGNLTYNAVEPKAAIAAITAGGKRYLDPTGIDLPAGTSDLAIDFAVLSLRMPERAHVRYKLDGQDSTWIDPGTRRQAFYTNLGPGTYTFRLAAANENGVRSARESVVMMTIAPTFAQSIWFKILVAAGIICLGALVYALRLRQVTAALHSRFNIRMAERERIARELHDTLLQSFQGLLLQFKAAADRVAEPGVKDFLGSAVTKAQRMLVEARDRVKELRTEPEQDDLIASLSQLISAERPSNAPAIRWTEEGSPRALHPLVRTEVKRIVEEAVRNAWEHACATLIDILVVWAPRELRLSVLDDGSGISPEILESGRKDHFGLLGMHERAERIGGALYISSRKSGGTEIALIVPAHAAYRDQDVPWFSWLLGRRHFRGPVTLPVTSSATTPR
jgi:signal transduction histidine kinase/streptogramin lyase